MPIYNDNRLLLGKAEYRSFIAQIFAKYSEASVDNLDVIALRDYLCCAFVPGERTLWQDIREIRPGTFIKMPSYQVYHYWQLQEQIIDKNQPLEWYGDQLLTLLKQVVKELLKNRDKEVNALKRKVTKLDNECSALKKNNEQILVLSDELSNVLKKYITQQKRDG